MEHLVLSCLESRLEGNGSIYGRFLLGPFKVGQGTTVATALRRTLLSELQGIAISAAAIKGAKHQYSSITGVRESTLDIVLNLKQIVLTGEITNGLPAVGYLAVQGPKTARARDLKLPTGIHCVDEDQYIASVSANGVLTIKFVVSAGKNYVPPHSPSPKTLVPSVFQPKMREGGTSPLALRASGQPLYSLVEMGRGNSPQDTRHGQQPLIRVGGLPRLSGGIDDIVVCNAARRATFAPPLVEVGLSPPLVTREDEVPTEAKPAKAGKPPLVGPLPGNSSETSQYRPTEPPVGKEANHFPVGGAQATRFRATRPLSPFPGLGVGEGGIFSAGIRQLPVGESGNGRELHKVKDENRSAEIALGGTQACSAALNHSQALTGLAQRGKQWETNSLPLPIDAVFMPVNKVNFSLQIDDQWQEPRERVVLEIWTNGSIHPRKAISEAATSLVYLFSLFRQTDALAAPNPLPPLRPDWAGSATDNRLSRKDLKTIEGLGQEGEGSNGSGRPHAR